MQLTQWKSEHPLVASLVDCYQLFVVGSPIELNTIPNGRIDVWMILEGGFRLYDHDKGTMEHAPLCGFIPSSFHVTPVKIDPQLVCVNIKFYPHVAKILSAIPKGQMLDNFDQLRMSLKLNNEGVDTISTMLDDFIVSHFIDDIEKHDWMAKVLYEMEHLPKHLYSIEVLADRFHTTVKTFNRRFKAYFDLTPKQFYSIFRFQRTIQHLAAHEGQTMLEGLDQWYFDQAHFIRECKRFTGLSPKQLMPRLKLATKDLLFVGGREAI